MNNLTILVLIVAGVVVAYLLEEWSEKTTHGRSGVENSKIAKHLFDSFPSGFYSGVPKTIDTVGEWFVATCLFTFEMFAVNIPGFQNLGLIYAVLGLTAFTVAIGERIAPKKLRVAAIADWSGYRVSFSKLIGIGILLSLIFVPISMFLAVGFQVKTLSITGMPVFSALTICLLIPAIEEGVFASTVGASFVEQFGVVPGIIGITAFWVTFHFLAYAPLTIVSIAYLGLFRVGAMIPVVKFKSSFPAFLAHIAVNTGALLASWGIIMG